MGVPPVSVLPRDFLTLQDLEAVQGLPVPQDLPVLKNLPTRFLLEKQIERFQLLPF